MRKRGGRRSPSVSTRKRATRRNKQKNTSLVSKRLEHAVLLVILLSLPFLIVQQLSPSSPTGLTISGENTTLLAYNGPSSIVFRDSLKMDLSPYFNGNLTYLATTAEGAEVIVAGDTLEINASPGTYEITVIGSDGVDTVRAHINFTSDVIEKPSLVAHPFSDTSFSSQDELGLNTPAFVNPSSKQVSFSYQPVQGKESEVTLFGVTPLRPTILGHFGQSPDSGINTEVFSIEDIEVDTAELVLAKYGLVETIYKCDDLDTQLFLCSAWNATPIPFGQNSTHIYFSVDSFSAFAGGEGSSTQSVGGNGSSQTQAEIAACGVITVSSNLTADVSDPGVCITITADDVELDCKGFTISYASSGNETIFQGVLSTSVVNTTIKNCIIRDVNEAGFGGEGIRLDRVNDSLVVNNTIQTNGTSSGSGVVLLGDSNRNEIVNNLIRTFGTSGANHGVSLDEGETILLRIIFP